MPEYALAVARLEQDLRPRFAGLEERRRHLSEAMSRAIDPNLQERARRLLEDDVIARPDDRALAGRDLAAISDELRVVREAIRPLEVERDQAHLWWSDAARREIVPLFRAQMRQLGAVVTALSDATIAHAELVDGMQTAGVMAGDDVGPLFFVGESMRLDRSEWSTSALWIREARGRGLLTG